MEKDMEDMFWEIPKHEAQAAISWAMSLVKGNKKDLWFAIHRGRLRRLDRIGKGTSRNFVNLHYD